MVITIFCMKMTVKKCIFLFLGKPIWDRILQQSMFQANKGVVHQSILILSYNCPLSIYIYIYYTLFYIIYVYIIYIYYTLYIYNEWLNSRRNRVENSQNSHWKTTTLALSGKDQKCSLQQTAEQRHVQCLKTSSPVACTAWCSLQSRSMRWQTDANLCHPVDVFVMICFKHNPW